MSVFNVNFSTLTRLLLPVCLRKDRMKAWLNSLVAPAATLHSTFLASRTDHLYELAHNSQIVYLEAALNDTFDPSGRNIIIEDGNFEDPLFTYLEPESKHLWLGLESETGATTYPTPQWLYTDAETSLLGFSFVVKVPAAVSFDAERMKAVINKYRLAGKNTYSITTY